MTGKHDTLANRLWAKIDKRSDSECWHWLASKNNKGYGMLRLGGTLPKKLAHRISFELCNGEIPEGKIVMHTCDNPACCNPSHLRLGTMLENTRDMIDKGRKVVGWNPDNKPPKFSGESHPRATITKEVALAIRESNGDRAELMQKYGVTVNIIKSIRSGRTWSHL